MPEPSQHQIALIDEVNYLRGRILTAYSQIEFLLADLSVKLDLKFPYLIKKRINAARRIADRAGYESYRDELNKVCDDLIEYDEIRNIMAHGFLMLTTDSKGNHRFDMRMYRRADEEFELLEIHTTIPRMRAGAQAITEYVRNAVRLFGRIYLEQGLERPTDGVLTEPTNP